MEINGVARGYLSRNLRSDQFFEIVADLIRKELNDWKGSFDVAVSKGSYFEITIKRAGTRYIAGISKDELETLQYQSPYAVDEYIWRHLDQQGFPIERGHGNYIPYVLGEYQVEKGKLLFCS
ncbi:MAG TPA: hypothetical protein VNQ57_00925 [Ureibacillus sp.]|nr:hypothetical protein [Ureibacillus sp.]